MDWLCRTGWLVLASRDIRCLLVAQQSLSCCVTPGRARQADASTAPSPSLLLFPFVISSWPEAERSRAQAQGLLLRDHVALQLGIYFLNILGKGRNRGSAYREVAVVGLLHLSCQF